MPRHMAALSSKHSETVTKNSARPNCEVTPKHALNVSRSLRSRRGNTAQLLASTEESTMEFGINWGKPIILTDGTDQDLIYVADDELNNWEGMPGVYIFARLYGDKVIPLYIGKTNNLGGRAWQHFKHNTRLMMGIRNAAKGKRVFIPGAFMARPGQNTQRCIALVESALISHALDSGYKLLNVKNTKTQAHTVNFSGYLGARNITKTRLQLKI